LPIILADSSLFTRDCTETIIRLEAAQVAAKEKLNEGAAMLLQYNKSSKLFQELETDVEILKNQHSRRLSEHEQQVESFEVDSEWQTLMSPSEKIARLRTYIEVTKDKAEILELELKIEEKLDEKNSQEMLLRVMKETWDRVTEDGDLLQIGVTTLSDTFEQAQIQWQNARKDDLIVICSEEAIEKLHSELDAERQSAAQRIADAVKFAVEDERRKKYALCYVGAYIRNRKLEWQKPEDQQDKTVKELGNNASHYGMALADAVLYEGSTPIIKRTDVEIYKSMYYVHPAFTLKYQRHPKLLDMLDWRGGMKDFMAHSYTCGSYDTTNFHHIFQKVFAADPSDTSDTYHKRFASWATDEINVKRYELLKENFKTALAKHNKYLSDRKRNRCALLSYF
jgi:hypothetical protein